MDKSENNGCRATKSHPDHLGHGQDVVSLLLGERVRAIGLVLIAATTLVVLLEVGAHESILVRVLAHAEAGNSDAVQRVHVIIGRARVLGLLGSSDGVHGTGWTGAGDGGSSHGQVMAGLAEVNVRRGFRNIERGLHETALQEDDEITEDVVLVKHSFHLLTKGINALVLFLELADVGFLALTESALETQLVLSREWFGGTVVTYLSSTVLGSTLGS